MTLESFASTSVAPSTRRRPWLEGVLLIGFFASLLVGASALAGLYYLETQTPEVRAIDPLNALHPDQVPPQLALRQLAGDAPAPLAYQAIQAGYLEFAVAVISFDTEMAPSERMGMGLLLARRMEEMGAAPRATDLYLLTAQAAILEPTILPLEQGRTLLQCAEGLLNAGEDELASLVGQQALAVANRTPGLLPAQRQQLFQPLAALFERAGQPQLRSVALELARNPFGPTSLAVVESRWPLPVQPALLDGSPLAVALENARALRQQAAANLAERIRLTDGLDIEQERNDLVQALWGEDQARRAWNDALLATGPTLETQQWIYGEQRAWASTKVRIALGGFGLRLVPEWEADPVPLLQELADSTVLLERTLIGQTQAITDPILHTATRLALLRWTAWQTARGLYPGRPVPDLVQGLQGATQELAEQTGASLPPLVYQESWTPTPFHYEGWR